VAAACARLRLLPYSQLFLSRYLIAIFRLVMLMPRPLHRLRARAGSVWVAPTLQLSLQLREEMAVLSLNMSTQVS
jgi:hypothetical protein